MQTSTQGKLIEFAAAFSRKPSDAKVLAGRASEGRTLLLEPRSVRHQERVNDLFYLLFKRTGS